MKKAVIFVIAIIIVSYANAQIQFGIKGGINFANLKVSEDDAGSKTNTRFNAGILLSIPFNRNLYLQPEVMYSGQGKEWSNGASFTYKWNYNYINVPILFKFQHVSGLFAETGPQIGFLTSAKFKSDGQSSDMKDQTKSTDFSWAFGVGYKIPIINLGIDIRYNLGLTITDSEILAGARNVSNPQTFKNSVFQLGLFYFLAIK